VPARSLEVDQATRHVRVLSRSSPSRGHVLDLGGPTSDLGNSALYTRRALDASGGVCFTCSRFVVTVC
jgi:hypothetical protein